MAVGYIYALSHPDMAGLLKIGFTSNTVEGRVRDLSSHTGVPSPFIIDYFHLSDHVEEVETLVHQELAAHRVNEVGNFFE